MVSCVSDPSRVIKVAKDHVGSVAFAVSDKEAFAQDLEQLGLDKSAEVVVGLFDSKGQKYPMTGTFRQVFLCEHIGECWGRVIYVCMCVNVGGGLYMCACVGCVYVCVHVWGIYACVGTCLTVSIILRLFNLVNLAQRT